MLSKRGELQQDATIEWRVITPRLALTGLLLLLLLAGFFYLANMAKLPNNLLDSYVFERIAPFITATHTRIMLFFTFLGSREFLLPANAALILYFLLIRKQKRWMIAIPVIALGTVAVNLLLKLYFSRPRPLGPLLQGIVGFSFPSGHSMSAFTFYGLFIYLAWNSLRQPAVKWICIIALALCILLVGISRIYLRAHYATDVLGGFAMGAIWLVISIWLLSNIEKFIRKRPPDIT